MTVIKTDEGYQERLLWHIDHEFVIAPGEFPRSAWNPLIPPGQHFVGNRIRAEFISGDPEDLQDVRRLARVSVYASSRCYLDLPISGLLLEDWLRKAVIQIEGDGKNIEKYLDAALKNGKLQLGALAEGEDRFIIESLESSQVRLYSDQRFVLKSRASIRIVLDGPAVRPLA